MATEEQQREMDTKLSYVLGQLEHFTVQLTNLESQLVGVEAKIQHLNAKLAAQEMTVSMETFADTFRERV
jgi:hypothetical protein